MVKILLTSLAAILLVSGAVGVTVVAAKEINMDEPLNALQTWSRQFVQERVELQEQEQLQIRLETGQAESSPEVQAQVRLKLKEMELLQTQNRIQIQEQIRVNQVSGSSNGQDFQWRLEANGTCNGDGCGSQAGQPAQTGDCTGTQQRGKP